MNQFDPLASRGGAAAPATPSAPSHQQQSSDPRVNYLQQQGFSSGMIHAILQSHAHPSTTRLWILDNSAAMATRDSHRIGPQFQNIPASRWEELQECVAYQAQMAATFGHTTRFSLLNPPSSSSAQSLPQQFTVSQPSELATVKHVMMNHAPAGPTLLTEELHKLKHYITSILPHLQQTRGSVTVVLATQGTPAGHPQAFIDALRALEGLPVWIVVRLCTDEERVVDFYNALDAQVNLPYDVLDDWFGESLEVYLRNPWLCYGLPLHRFREIWACGCPFWMPLTNAPCPRRKFVIWCNVCLPFRPCRIPTPNGPRFCKRSTPCNDHSAPMSSTPSLENPIVPGSIYTT